MLLLQRSREQLEQLVLVLLKWCYQWCDVEGLAYVCVRVCKYVKALFVTQPVSKQAGLLQNRLA